jgi:hypothetical protein
MRKFSCLFLVIVLVFSLGISANAADYSKNESSPSENELVVLSSGTRNLEANDAVSLLVTKAGYSYDEAVQLCNHLEARGVSLGERWIVYDAGMGYSIEVGCLIEIECGSGHCNFGDVIEKWSNARGSGDYDWVPFYVYAEVGDPYDTSINFRSRGNLEVTVATSSSAGFEAAGFSVVGSVSTTTTYRKTISINETWTVGDPLE